LVLAAALGGVMLLASCSSDGNASDDGIQGAGGSDSQPDDSADDDPEPDPEPEEPAPQESAPQDDGIERPEIDLGDAYQNTYDPADLTGDPVTDAILRDSQGFQDAIAEGIVHLETDRPAITFYAKGDALDRIVSVIGMPIDAHESSAGTARYFNREVTLFEDGESAAVLYCRDFSQVATVDPDTGDVIEEADTDAKPTLYATRVERNELGVWQTSEYSTDPEAPECE
jgi:hypothetical protein